MVKSKEQRIKELEIRIEKLSANPGVNGSLIKKAQRQIRKLSA